MQAPHDMARRALTAPGPWLFSVLWLFCGSVQAEPTHARPMVFDHIGVEHGMSQGTVTRIHQDRHGFIWIATESGLNRYDGNAIQRFVYARETEGALVNDYIWDIAEDSAGRLWLATDGGGLAVFDPVSAAFTHYRNEPGNANSPTSDHVRSVAVDSRGAVWVGTRDAGLSRLDAATGEFRHFDNPNPSLSPPPDATVFDIIEDASGALWFGTTAGLYRHTVGSRTMLRYRHRAGEPGSLSDDTVIAVHEDAEGTIWAGTYEGGLNALDVRTGTFRRFGANPDDVRALPSNYVRDVLEDDDGRLWVATTAGLALLDRDSGTFTTYVNERDNPASLGSSYTMSLFQDRGGVLWVGTRGAGAASWNPRSWSLGLVRRTALGDSIIVGFAAEPGEALWVATMNSGLQRFGLRSGEMTPASALFGDALAGLRTMSVALDRRRHLWVGTMGSGLRQIDLDAGTVTAYAHDPDDTATLSSNGIMSLHADARGAIWAGTFGGGLNRVDPALRTVERIAGTSDAALALSQARITAIAEDPTGTLWLATDGDGLFAYHPDTGAPTQYLSSDDDASTLSTNRLYAVYHDDDAGRLWVGTAGRGLDVLDTAGAAQPSAAFTNVSMADGLPDNVIYGVQPDPLGRLWLSTNGGLVRYDPTSGAIRSYHARHGLQGEEFNFGAHHRGADGSLYFGGVNGFNAFRPELLADVGPEPDVVLAGMTVGNAALAAPTALPGVDAITLRHDDDIVSFELAVTDYVDPAKNRIAHKLEGFDEAWIAPDTSRRLTYTNLAPGDYALKARAVSSSGTAGDEKTLLTIRVLRAPWATWWAIAVYALLGALLTWQALRWYRRRVEHEAEMERLAHSDPLTGLANRSHFLDYVAGAIAAPSAYGGNVAVLAIDFNHIKRINDSFGHNAGDRALKALANRLMHTVARMCRDMGVCETSRLSGDEFAIVLAGRGAVSRAERLGGHIVSHFVETRINDNDRLALATSVGIACFPDHGREAETLVRNAQAAAHVSREQGNGRCLVYSDDIAARLQDRLALEQDLRRALALGQFHLLLQPKFDTRWQTLTGAEALIRWLHPVRGVVSPVEFIPVAEETGVIADIGRWVVEAAARQVRDWQAQGQPVVPIAVNLSGVEFHAADPARTVRTAAAAAGIDPRLLHVELTESVIMHDAEQTHAALTALKTMGCRLSIDDFGTGYSSLAYLRRFPIDTLKIDRAFVSDVPTSEEDRSICAAIIAMAHGLNLKVVAEGIETEAQFRALARLGCDEVQGFLLGKPVPAGQFAALFGARAPAEDGPHPVPFISAG